MIVSYKTVYEGRDAEIVEKKSKFIATVRHVESEEEAIRFIDELKKKYWNASHNCFAFIVGTNSEIMRFSDDGEPGGTAGKPILEVLMGQKLCNTLVVVTRYFGGILLGTGGLVRAYTKSAIAGLDNSVIIEKKLGRKFVIISDYNTVGKIQYVLGEKGIKIRNSEYSDIVKLTIVIPVGEIEVIKNEIVESTNGRVKIQEMEQVYYAEADKQLIADTSAL